ncbi:MAG: NAD-dependent epimerase/dehydratase family protein [Anaerolineaceae bacterium]|jgi:NADH dehydrogenase|nr:NAD-dependent epimerase/dehydratase family protein [Anaerolineaceae bacterium]
MILVTGGTGFIGRTLVRNLVSLGYPVRTLLKPSKQSPKLPKNTPVEVTVCSLNDVRGLMAALKDVDTVFHFAGTERLATRADLNGVDILGTKNIIEAAQQSKISHFFFLSHLGSDKNSAYPVLKAKAIAEKSIEQSGIPYTIFRCSNVYGPGDQFVVSLARLLRLSPGFFFLPGNGLSALQPLWIDDLITSLLISMENKETLNEILEIGGGEVYTFRDIVEMILITINLKRSLIQISPGYLRILAVYMDQFMKKFPVSLFWLDTLAEDRTTRLDVLPRRFGILPARFSQKINFLQNELIV